MDEYGWYVHSSLSDTMASAILTFLREQSPVAQTWSEPYDESLIPQDHVVPLQFIGQQLMSDERVSIITGLKEKTLWPSLTDMTADELDTLKDAADYWMLPKATTVDRIEEERAIREVIDPERLSTPIKNLLMEFISTHRLTISSSYFVISPAGLSEFVRGLLDMSSLRNYDLNEYVMGRCIANLPPNGKTKQSGKYYMAVACALGDPVSLKLACEWRPPFPSKCIYKAIDMGNLENLRMLHEHGVIDYNSEYINYAIHMGKLPIAKWFYESGYPVSEVPTVATINTESKEALLWLRSIGCEWTATLTNYAAARGFLSMLQWLIENGCPFSREACLMHAAMYQQETVVNWIESLDVGM